MALSGSHRTWFTDWNYVEFSWTATQSIDGNYSTVSWRLNLVAVDANGAINSSASKKVYVGITGYAAGYTYETIGISGGTTKTLRTGTAKITHDKNGAASFTATYNVELGITFSGIWLEDAGGSPVFTLDTIPRLSKLNAGAGTLGEVQTLSITRKVTDAVYKIRYNCGSASGYAAGSASDAVADTSINWTPPLSLASQNKTGTSVSVTLTLDTYLDNTLLGSYSKTITCNIPDSVKPTASFTLEDVTGVDDIYGTPVQGLSRIKFVVKGTLAYGSPIKTYSVTANGTKYNTAEATTGTLKTSGDSPVTATVTDGRGRTGSVSYTMKVKAYERPNVTALTVHRCTADGTESEQGEYIRAVFSATVTDIGGLGKNAPKYKLRYKKTSAASYTEVAFSALTGQYAVANQAHIFAADSGSSYDVEVVAEDSHVTTTRSTSASTAFTLMNWGADGTSLGVGKVAEKANTMEVALDMYTTGTHEHLGNRFCLSSPGVAAEEGYVLMARITVTAANADTPITFVFSRRAAATPMTVHVQLKNSTATASELSTIRYEGTNYGAFLVKAGALIWDLYVLKGSNWDTITLQDWWTSKTMESRVTVVFPGTLVETLPGDYYRATPAMLDSLRDYIYPVGSVYICYSHVSPADLFGGTWVRIENAFLWGVDSKGTIGQTGGEKTHTLTLDEIPAHSHGSVYSQHVDATKLYPWLTTSSSPPSLAYGAVPAGGGAAHNNMPPYVQVSIWRRTA